MVTKYKCKRFYKPVGFKKRALFLTSVAMLVVATTLVLGSPSVTSAGDFNIHVDGIFFRPNYIWVYDWDPSSTLGLTFVRPPDTDPYCVILDQAHLTEGSMIDLTDTCASYFVEPGDIVKITDGTNTKSHTVTNVTVTDVDYENDIISGTADPNTGVVVVNHQGFVPLIEVAADKNGDWIANYREEWDFDITICHSGEALQYDGFGCSTQFSWAPTIWCGIEDVLAIFNDWVHEGALVGPRFKIRGMRILLKLAANFLNNGNTRLACMFLNIAYLRCDGLPEPNDLVTGSAQEELASLIGMQMDSLQCE
jgi:hypothetical protein